VAALLFYNEVKKEMKNIHKTIANGLLIAEPETQWIFKISI